MFVAVLVLAAAARGDIVTGFEQPPINAAPPGVPLWGQDGWYNPVAGSAQHLAYTYTGNQFGFLSNPQGASQFIAGLSPGGTTAARAEHLENFGGGDVWSLSVDVAAKFVGSLPASNNLGSFSLQDSTIARSFTGLMTWTNPATPTTWQLGYVVHDAAGVQVPVPGLFAGSQWQGLLANRWYRVTTTWSFSANRILTVSIRDLVTGITSTARPNGWFLAGGATPALPVPTAVRLFTGGTTSGNIVGWDNVFCCSPRVDSFNPPSGPEGTVVQIDGCGFGDVVDDLSVAVVMPDGTGIPLTVVSATNSRIVAKLGPVPPDAVMGPIAVSRGLGLRGMNPTSLDDVIPENPAATLVWDRTGFRALSPFPFVPVITAPPVGQTWWCGHRVPAGVMELTVTGVWQPNTSLRVFTKLHDTVQGIGDDVEAVEVRLRCGGDALYLAERIRDAVLTAYSTRGINTACSITNAGPNLWTLSLSLLDPSFVLVPVDFGVFTVVASSPSLVTPFAVGPVTGFYQSALTQPGGSAQVNNVDQTGEDGATISPLVPTNVGIHAATLPIDLDVSGESFTVRSWGTLNALVPHQLVQTARMLRAGPVISITGDAAPIGSAQLRVEVWNNSVMSGSMVVPNGIVGQITAGASGMPLVVGYGTRPRIGPAEPLVWMELDRAVMVTPTGGLPLTGNQVRLCAVSFADDVSNIEALDSSAGLIDPADLSMYVILNSYEGGICYANCDGSAGTPRLTSNDFQCFINAFASGAAGANCDGSTGTPTLTANDFQCFINQFAGGCP